MASGSARYTHGHHETVLRSHTWRTVENSAAYLIQYLESGRSLLDVGCGPGTITDDLAARLAPGSVIGLDASAGVVATAAATAVASNVQFVVGDAYSLPFDDGTFDIVHAHQTLQHLADPVAALREMRRVLVPGGILAARDVDYAGTFWFPVSPGLLAWQTLYDSIARSNGGEPDAGRRLLSWAREAGFSEIRPTASVWTFATPDDRAWWGGMWADRVLQSAFAVDALDKGFATQHDLDHISNAWRAWSMNEDATMIMPHGEVICVA